MAQQPTEGPSERPDAEDRAVKNGNLPTNLTRFVGRDRELSKLTELLDEDRLVTLVGPGGCGKTRLAVEVARHTHGGYDGGCWFVDLTTLSSGESLSSLVTSILGMPPSTEAVSDRLVNHFSESRSLLILDNCEHLVDDVAALADSIVQRCPLVRLLATSREPLGVEGERVYRVGSLLLADAVSLFLDRAGRAAAETEVSEQDHQTIATICKRLDGIPLAVELAAACVGSMTPQGILRQLDERFLLLVGGRRASPRHRTLRAAIEWSEELLTPAERRVFYRLGVFVGGFDLTAAVQVATDAELEAEEVGLVLRRLVERSMVIVDRQAGLDRYQLLETLSDFALERLVTQRDAERTRGAHALHFSERANASFLAGRVPTSPQEAEAVREARHSLGLELGNYRAALEYTHSNRSPLLATLAIHLTPLWSGVTGPQEGLFWLSAALASVSPEDKQTQKQLTECLMEFSATSGDLAAAKSYSHELVVLLEESGDPRDQWEGLLNLARIEARDDNMAASRVAADRALEAARSLGDPEALVCSLMMAAAVRRCEAAELELAQALEDEMTVVVGRAEDRATRSRLQLMMREYLTENQLQYGDADSALPFYRELLGLEAELLDAESYDYPYLRHLASVAAILVMTGRPARGVRLAGAIDEACEQRGFGVGVLWGDDHRETVDDAQRAMGARGRALYKAGRKMSMGEAKAYAMEDAPDDTHLGVRLTRREREVADLVREGLTDPQIAEQLVLSVRTVEGHVENLRGKLGVNTRSGVAAWAAVNLP